MDIFNPYRDWDDKTMQFTTKYDQMYEQAVYPDLTAISTYVKQRVNQVDWNQVNTKYQQLLADFYQYYQQNKDRFKNELQSEAQRRYTSSLADYQEKLRRYAYGSRPYNKPIEPQLKIIRDDVVLTYTIDYYIKQFAMNRWFNINNYTEQLVNEIGIRDFNPTRLLSYLVQNKPIQQYVNDLVVFLDTEVNDFINDTKYQPNKFNDEIFEIINKIEKVAVPNLLPDYLQPNGYQWHYFNFLNTNVPQIQSYLGISPALNANNFEQYANIFSLSKIYGQTVSGWTKDTLLEAIFKSGLMVPDKAFKNTHEVRVEGNNAIMDRVSIDLESVLLKPEAIVKLKILANTINYSGNLINDQGYISHDFYIELEDHFYRTEEYKLASHKFFNTIMTGYNLKDIYASPQNYSFTSIHSYTYGTKNPRKAQIVAYRLMHCLPYRSIGENKDGCIRFNVLSNHEQIDEIYRKIYGTIYTINWPEFCQSGRVQIIYPQRLQQIITTYFNPGYDVKITSYDQFCQLVLQQLPAIQQYMQGVASPEEWFQFIRSRYNQRIIQPTKRTIQISSDQPTQRGRFT